MDRIEKILRKMRRKEQEAMLLVMMQIKKDFRKLPNLKPLTGMQNWYRVRVGRYRIIFLVEHGQVEIRKITKRDDQTYRHLN